MMNTSIFFLSFVFFFTSVTADKPPINSDNFGPYDVIHKRYETCKGPKTKDAAVFSTNVTIRGNQKLKYFHLEFPTDTSIDEVRTSLYSLTDDKKKMLYNFKMKEPCRHFYAAALIKKNFHSDNCIVAKGSYIFTLDPEGSVKLLLGPKFFYGDYLFKSHVISKLGNIMCMIIEHEIVKKD